MTTAVSSADTFASLNTGNTTQTKNEAGSADRFLKLLVTQMQNQDPLNPMDNAQVTSQMAQINTVNGIETLNTSVQAMNTQFVQTQALQGASLVGREVTLAGNRVDLASGVGSGGFDLASTADAVKVEVLNPAGKVVGTVDMGALTAGHHDFDWNAPAGTAADAKLSFRVTATKGTQSIGTTLLTRDTVDAVASSPSGLVLQTRHSGDVAYSVVKAFN